VLIREPWRTFGSGRGKRNEQRRLNRIHHLLGVYGISRVWPAQLGSLHVSHLISSTSQSLAKKEETHVGEVLAT
jgi:hypothetical protein